MGKSQEVVGIYICGQKGLRERQDSRAAVVFQLGHSGVVYLETKTVDAR